MKEINAPKLVQLPKKEEGQLSGGLQISGARPRELRRSLLALSFLLCVILPSFLGAIYYAFVASDRYVASAGFAIRGMDTGISGDLIGAVTGLASIGSTTSDSYILLKYFKSRDLVERLAQDFSFDEVYRRNDVDYFSRLGADTDIEYVVDYWRKRIHTTFDSTSSIITFEVEAFSPELADQVANRVLDYGRELVNQLSSRAREDALSYAQGEVERSELRLKTALDALRMFRNTEGSIDPAGAARIQLELIGGLERELAGVKARISALEGSVASDAPSMRNLRRQAEAIESQIAFQRREIGENEGGVAGTALTGQLAAFETLEVERTFAQQALSSALISLEKARVEADRQQRYLAVYSAPALPQVALYPRRILNSFLILIGLTVVWGICALTAYAVRDHIS
jgi:capsular polysaccharide transport system permease protein